MVRTRSRSYGEIPTNNAPIGRRSRSTSPNDRVAPLQLANRQAPDVQNMNAANDNLNDPPNDQRPPNDQLPHVQAPGSRPPPPKDDSNPPSMSDEIGVNFSVRISDLYKYTRGLTKYEQKNFEEFLTFKAQLESLITKLALESDVEIDLESILDGSVEVGNTLSVVVLNRK